MEDHQKYAPPPEHRIDPALRQRLIKRIALAGVAIAALLGGLAVIDRYYVPPPATASRALTASLTPSSPKPPEVPPAAAPVVAPPAPTVAAIPEQSSSPSITRPAGPAAKPAEMAKTAKPPRPVATGVVTPAAQAKAAPTKAPIAENDRPMAKSTAGHAAPSKPLARDTPKQYVFQMGIFNDVANAQRLNEKLKESGVPSRIEARVQVGPFKTRKEAEEARKKLIALGINPGTLTPVRK